MSAKIINGKEIAAYYKRKVAIDADEFKCRYGFSPGLAVVIAGDDPASQTYVASKNRTCREHGFYSEVVCLPVDISPVELLRTIEVLNNRRDIHGVLVQLPLPGRQASAPVLAAINPEKDVDGFHPVNVGKLSIGEPCLVPCTPLGIMKMLAFEGVVLAGRRAVIIGRSNIVGKPLLQLLLAADATVTVCHSKTEDIAGIASQADILIAAVGRPGFVRAEMVKPGATVIDVGINRLDGKLIGDVDFASVSLVAGHITPVPGGVGPMTIAMLLNNTLQAACRLQLAQ